MVRLGGAVEVERKAEYPVAAAREQRRIGGNPLNKGKVGAMGLEKRAQAGEIS
jgi:hypothetical protein